ncbi:choice-of-anchor U domain-containing protein [Thermus sediminis]|uniref:choice-of-anchor U domain-containing protein n=1 Tax=Thermus sediminis TaxID=1761908 RepID=UPI0018E5223F|nr:choice-of-anchor U domain-containing protein [Thermus sediminis]
MRIGAWYGFLTGLALLLAACSGGAPPPDLTLAGVSPNNPTVAQGSSLPLTLTFTSQNGFQGQVSLSVTENGQAPPWLTFSPTSASLNVPRGGQAQVTLQVQVARNAPTGPHSLSLRATYGERSAERSLTLNVTPPPDFAIALNPDSLTVQQGSSGTVQLTLTPQNGFTGTVNLSLVAGQDPVPQGLSLSPTSLTVSGSNPLTRDLTLTAGATTPTGIYRLKVRATGGNVTKDAELTVTVSASSGGGGGSNSGTVNTPGGQVGMGLQGGTFTQGPTYQSVTPPEGFQAPYGAIAFTAQVPQGGTLTVTLTFPQAIPQGAVLRKFVNGTWREVPGAQFSGNTATYQVRDGGDLDADGQANGQIVDPVALLTPSPDFTLSLNPDSLTIQQGGSGTTQLTLTPQGGFTGPVNLSLVDGNGNPVSGISLSPTTVSVSDPNNPVTPDLTVNVASSVAPGSYNLQVRAVSGSLTKTAGLSLTVTAPPPPPTFTLSDPNPNPLSVSQGSTATFGVTLVSQNGFQGEVNLSLADGQDPLPQGLAITATNPSPIILQAGGSVTVTATVSAGQGVDPGTYRLKVRAQGEGVVQEKPLSVQVVLPPTFDLGPVRDINGREGVVTTRRDPSNRLNNSVYFTITPRNGFQGQVDLSLVDEGGNPVPGLSLDPASVNVTGTQTFSVYVLADNNIPLFGAGKGYAVRLRARSGDIVREQPLTVDVWTRVGGANLNFQRVAYGNGIFVIAGTNGYDQRTRAYVYNPQDGSFTKTFDAGPEVCGWLSDVAYDPAHRTWVAVGGGTGLVIVSTDNAQTWQIVFGAKDPNRHCSQQYDGREMPLERVRFVNDRLWAWYTGGMNPQRLYFSQDGGYTWNFISLPIPSGYQELVIRGLTFGQGKYVAVGEIKRSDGPDYPMLAISPNGTNWNVMPLDTPQTPWGRSFPTDILYVPDWDKFVMVGDPDLVATSSDGVNWSFHNIQGQFASLAYGNGAVVAGSGSFPIVVVSTDGQNWRVVPTGCPDAAAMSVAFGSGIFAHTSAWGFCTSP